MGAGKGYFTGYPKRIGFILGNEFCERFSFYGMKAILVIFLTRALDFSDNNATAIYHGFNMACYFMPLFGAMLADGYLGHYKTIFSISIVYAIGNVIMAVGAVPLAGEEYIKALPFVGLVLIAIGTGGIKPCVAAFGADQFEDHQVRQKQSFFSMLYLSINVGSLLSTILTPIIRSRVRCFDDECYALAFGIPACLMFVALALFMIGTHWYKIIPPGENIIGKLFGCIGTALKGKCGCSKDEKYREHWLDYADSKYEKTFIEDVKSVIRVLYMFLPLPMFYALFDQQGSRWTLQADRMDGDLGGFVLEPDLVKVINPILIVIFVPITESILFPCFDKLNIPNSPLQRLGVGMFFAGTAFVLSGFLQIAIDKSQPPSIPTGQARFKIINAIPCDISGSVANHTFSIPFNERMDMDHLEPIDVTTGNYTFSIQFENCDGQNGGVNIPQEVSLSDQESYNFIAYWDIVNSMHQFKMVLQPLVTRTEKGSAKIQFFNAWKEFELVKIESEDDKINGTHLELSEAVLVPHRTVDVDVGGQTFEVDARAGAVYTAVLHYLTIGTGNETRTLTQYQDISPNSISVLLIFPQYVVMTVGEVFFSVTGLSFAYSQSPPSMKAVLQASWLMCASMGNLIVMVITAAGSLSNQMAEFFMFAGLMYLTMIIFAVMSLTYQYVEPYLEEDSDVVSEKSEKSEKEGVNNLGLSLDDPPPHYDIVIPEGARPYITTYM